MSCTLCNDTGVTEKNEKCICVWKREIDLLLPDFFKSVTLNQSLYNVCETAYSNMPLNIFATRDIRQFRSLVKYVVTKKYVETDGHFSVKYLDGTMLTDIMFERNVIGWKDILDLDLLVITLGYDARVTNQADAVNQAVLFYLHQRINSGLPVWVHCPVNRVNKIPVVYSKDLLDLLQDRNIFSTFSAVNNI